MLLDFIKMSNAGIDYFDFQEVKKDGKCGYRYLLCRPLTDPQREFLSQYSNVIIGTARNRYAPEIRHDTVILMDEDSLDT